MSISVNPNPPEQRRQRILIAPKWGDAWEAVKMLGEGDGVQKLYGFEVESLSRKVFPDVGQAVVTYHYGWTNERLFQIEEEPNGENSYFLNSAVGDGEDSEENRRLRFTGSNGIVNPLATLFDFSNVLIDNTFVVPDIRNYEIRIQEDINPENTIDSVVTPAEWVTAWWGKVTTPIDIAVPGAEIPEGIMQYVCFDGTARMAEWKLNRHVFSPDNGSTVYPHPAIDPNTALGTCPGNPGYNTRQDNLGRIIGNMSGGAGDINGKGLWAHTWASPDADQFTDSKAITTAIQSGKPLGTIQPDFDLIGEDGDVDGNTISTLAALDGVNAWHVQEHESVRSLLRRIFAPSRGIPAGLDWVVTDEDNLTAANFKPKIRVGAFLYDSIDDTLPVSGDAWRIVGADAIDRAQDFDVTGDQRLDENGFRFNDDGISRYDKLITRGEFITTVITVDKDIELIQRWTQDEEDALDAAQATDYIPTKFDHVLHDYGFPLNWDWQRGEEPSKERVDIRMDFDATTNANTISKPDTNDDVDTSPFLLRVLDYTPFYKGMDYGVSPPAPYTDTIASYDQISYGKDTVGIMAFDDTLADASVSIGASVSRAGNQGNDLRISIDSGSLEVPDVNLKFTLAIQCGHRLQWQQIRTTDFDGTGTILPEANVRKVKEALVQGAALHVGLTTTQWITNSGNPGFLPTGTEAVPVLRDDRDQLYKRHALLAKYYLLNRRPVTIPLKTVGATAQAIESEVTGVTDTGGAAQPQDFLGNRIYKVPKFLEFIHDLAYSGRNTRIDGPVTSWEWERQGSTVTIETDWGDRGAL